MKSKNIEPAEKWEDVRKKLNITLEQEIEIRLEKEIIQAIVAVRKNSNMTQEELSRKTGLKQSVIARLEKSKNSPRIDTTLKILIPMGYTLKVMPVDKDIFV
ncbi:MAG: helix-turn-helix transcriptional regulator [Lachnospiraceae bacterium]|jgi:DNA-binding phage protein|nr:helix-turn-helix transcriptional regulator [Lachnospiraceae bacterium]